MGLRILLSVVLATTMLTSAAQAQVVVMRRTMDLAVAGATKGDEATTPVATPTPGTWSATPWTTEGSTCGTIHQTRTAVCSGGTCDDAARPIEEQDVAGPQCVMAWVPGDQGAWSSTCSDAATRTSPYSCTSHPAEAPDEVTQLPDAACISAGVAKPGTTETQPVYTGCTHQWITGTWGDSCGPATTSTRTVTCQRSGQGYATATVSDDYCDASTKPASTQDNSASPTYTVCIPDPSFEAGGAGWGTSTAAQPTTDAHTGAKAMLLTGYYSLQQVAFASVPGETYTASVWYKSKLSGDQSTSVVAPFIGLGPSSYMFSGYYNFVDASTTWKNFSVSWTATSATTYLSLSIVNSSIVENTVTFDDVQVVATRH